MKSDTTLTFTNEYNLHIKIKFFQKTIQGLLNYRYLHNQGMALVRVLLISSNIDLSSKQYVFSIRECIYYTSNKKEKLT